MYIGCQTTHTQCVALGRLASWNSSSGLAVANDTCRLAGSPKPLDNTPGRQPASEDAAAPEAAGPAPIPDIPPEPGTAIKGTADEAPQGTPQPAEQYEAGQEAAQPAGEAVQRSRAEDLAVQLRVVEGMEVGSGRIKLSLLAFDSLVSSRLHTHKL